MEITLEIKNLSDWMILRPLLKRLQIKIVDKKNLEEKMPTTSPPEKEENKKDILQFAGILSEEEAAVFTSAIEESRQIDLDEW